MRWCIRYLCRIIKFYSLKRRSLSWYYKMKIAWFLMWYKHKKLSKPQYFYDYREKCIHLWGDNHNNRLMDYFEAFPPESRLFVFVVIKITGFSLSILPAWHRHSTSPSQYVSDGISCRFAPKSRSICSMNPTWFSSRPLNVYWRSWQKSLIKHKQNIQKHRIPLNGAWMPDWSWGFLLLELCFLIHHC